jgi:hypothetical protein
MNEVIFHLAFPVANIPQTKLFYVDGLGCEVGRESPNSIILGLYGHQIVAHISHEPLTVQQRGIYPRHFGLVFTSEDDWKALLERSQQNGLHFYQEAKQRFVGLPTEHWTFFLQDPFYNLLEFKYYREMEAIFGHREFTQVGDAV